MTEQPKAEIAARIGELLAARGPGKTICPSEVARSLAPTEAQWRALMPQVRAVADDLAQAGQLVVTQRGQVVQASTAIGPIRLGKPPRAQGLTIRRSSV